MIETWYNTLNTIAQSLSAILGLVAVFFILRVEQIARMIVEYRDDALVILGYKQHHISNYSIPKIEEVGSILQDIKKISESYDTEVVSNGGFDGDMQVLVSRMNDYKPGKYFKPKEYVTYIYEMLNYEIDQRNNLMKLALFPAILTSFTIIMVFIFLYCSDVINSYLLSSKHLVFLLIVIFAILSLYSLMRACWCLIKGATFYNNK